MFASCSGTDPTTLALGAAGVGVMAAYLYTNAAHSRAIPFGDASVCSARRASNVASARVADAAPADADGFWPDQPRSEGFDKGFAGAAPQDAQSKKVQQAKKAIAPVYVELKGTAGNGGIGVEVLSAGCKPPPVEKPKVTGNMFYQTELYAERAETQDASA